MFLVRWYKNAREALGALKDMLTTPDEDYISEEQVLVEELKQLDRESPGWDREARIASCETAMKIGLGREDLVIVYGDDVVSEAVERLSRRQIERRDEVLRDPMTRRVLERRCDLALDQGVERRLLVETYGEELVCASEKRRLERERI